MKKTSEEPTRAELHRMAAITGYDVRTVARVIGGGKARSLATEKTIHAAWERTLRARKAAES